MLNQIVLQNDAITSVCWWIVGFHMSFLMLPLFVIAIALGSDS